MSYFTDLSGTLARVNALPLLPFVQQCAGTLWLAGNGGSAAIAQHWACDLSKASHKRVQALGCNPAVLTAWANDTSYGAALAAELDRLHQAGDRLLMLSCSGMSANIGQLISYARQARIPHYLITGGMVADVPNVRIPHDDYGIIEDCFSAIGHWLTKELA